ncbi:MAG: hypothetical protein H0X24_07260 [Ktedonobacterales bacterium]|nr:hypothetical protein [Ktedonobacterales bacterium]
MFARYDVRASWWGLRGTARLGAVWQAWRHQVSGTLTTGQTHQLPAEMLIGPDGLLQIAHYGQDTGDFLTVTAIETALTRTAAAALAGPPDFAETPLRCVRLRRMLPAVPGAGDAPARRYSARTCGGELPGPCGLALPRWRVASEGVAAQQEHAARWPAMSPRDQHATNSV